MSEEAKLKLLLKRMMEYSTRDLVDGLEKMHQFLSTKKQLSPEQTAWVKSAIITMSRGDRVRLPIEGNDNDAQS